MSKRFYPESYDKQASKLVNRALLVMVIVATIGIVVFLGVYCIGL